MPRASLRKAVESDLSLGAGLVLASSPFIHDYGCDVFEADCLLLARLPQCQLIALIAMLPEITPSENEGLMLCTFTAAHHAALVQHAATSNYISAASDSQELLILHHQRLLAIIGDAYRRMQGV